MAYYAAVLSLFHTLNNIKKQPCPPICLDQSQLDSLKQNLTFLQDFLECHSSSREEEDDVLESRITTAAYIAKDVIETHIVDRIHHARSTSNRGKNISYVDLYGCIESDTRHEFDQERGDGDLDHWNPTSSPSAYKFFRGASSMRQSSTMTVFDEAMVNQVLDMLTGQQSNLQIIPIVGMGEIGKTTFARYIYKNSLIVHHFDNLVCLTISQDYSVLEILAQVLCLGNRENGLSENELAERVQMPLIFKHKQPLLFKNILELYSTPVV